MQIDGRIVGQALAKRLRPVGFSHFQGRHAWRRRELTVDLVTFPSMNAFVAEGVGCPSFSFSGEAGVYYAGVNNEEPIEWPRDYHLTVRGSLSKTIRQPFFHPYGRRPEEIPEWRRGSAGTSGAAGTTVPPGPRRRAKAGRWPPCPLQAHRKRSRKRPYASTAASRPAGRRRLRAARHQYEVRSRAGRVFDAEKRERIKRKARSTNDE